MRRKGGCWHWQLDFCFPAPAPIAAPLPSAFSQTETAKQILEEVVKKNQI